MSGESKGLISRNTGPGEWVSFRRFTSKLSWSWSCVWFILQKTSPAIYWMTSEIGWRLMFELGRANWWIYFALVPCWWFLDVISTLCWVLIWASSWQNQQNGMCAQRRRSPVWSVFASAWRKLRSLATHWAHSEDSDQTGRIPRLIWVFAGRTCHFVGFVTFPVEVISCLHFLRE